MVRAGGVQRSGENTGTLDNYSSYRVMEMQEEEKTPPGNRRPGNSEGRDEKSRESLNPESSDSNLPQFLEQPQSLLLITREPQSTIPAPFPGVILQLCFIT
jgi:hypothetical protein